MRFLLLLCALVASVSLTSCGKDRSVGGIFTGTNGAGIEGSFSPSRLDDKWAIGTITLRNTSAKPVQFANFMVGNTYPGFRITVGNGPEVSAIQDVRVNPWIGVVTVVNGVQLSEIPAGTDVNLSLKWRLTHEPKKNSPWTVRITGMVQDGKPIPDVKIGRTAE